MLKNIAIWFSAGFLIQIVLHYKRLILDTMNTENKPDYGVRGFYIQGVHIQGGSTFRGFDIQGVHNQGGPHLGGTFKRFHIHRGPQSGVPQSGGSTFRG
jgi:hypothetical protein